MDHFVNKHDEPIHSYFIRFLIGFVTFSGYLNFYLINYGTNHLTKGLDIFPHKVNLYMCKLFGLRSLLSIMGSLTHHLIAVYHTKNYTVFTIVSLCSIFLNRMTLLIVLYKSLSLSFYFFIISILEAFVSGFFQNSLLAIVPEHTTTIILSVDISLILTLGSKLIICYFCKENALTIIKVEAWISVSINIISIAMLLFYIFHYYNRYVQTYEDGMKKVKDLLENLNEIHNCLNKIDDIDETLGNMILTIDEMNKQQIKDLIDNEFNITYKLDDLKMKLENEFKNLYENDIYGKVIVTIKKKSQEIYNKTQQFKNFYVNQIKSEYQFKKIRKIEEFYNYADSLYTFTMMFTSRLASLNIDEIDRIKVKIDELGDKVQNINKALDTIDTNNKNVITMADKLKDSLSENLQVIKVYVNKLKKKLELDDTVKKLKPGIIKSIIEINYKMKEEENNLTIIIKKCAYKYLIILIGSVFKDFLNNNIIPKSILKGDKSYMIEKVTTPFYFIASLMVVCLHHNIENQQEFENNLDFLGALDLIPFVIFVITLTAIHSKLSFFKNIINSQYKVISLASLLILSFRIVESWTYISISDIIEWTPEYKYSVCALTLHHVLTVSYSYLINKVSKGYTETMISLGYTVPFIEPKNKQTTKVWYLLKNTVKSTFKSTVFDLRMNIRELI